MKTRVFYDENQLSPLLATLSVKLPLRRGFAVGCVEGPFVIRVEDRRGGSTVVVYYDTASHVIETVILVLYAYAFALAVDEQPIVDATPVPAKTMCDAVEHVYDVLKLVNNGAAKTLMLTHHHPKFLRAVFRGGYAIEGEEDIGREMKEAERGAANAERAAIDMARTQLMQLVLNGGRPSEPPKC